MTSIQERKIRQTGCDARFDNLTRQLYATDASIYQIEPVGVAFPKSAQQANAVIRAAADAALSITPRGAGTSLDGNAIGEGLIVDFSRYNRQITDLDLEKRSVHVGAGVVLDQLNEFFRTTRILFRTRCRNQLARDARRHDRQQFVRRTLPDLWNDSRSRHFAGNCDGGRSHRKDRSEPRVATRRASENRGTHSRSDGRNG